MYNYVRLFVILVLSLKVCHTTAKSLSNKSQVYSKASAPKQNSNSSVSSYYRHDPYGPNTYAFGFEVNDKRTGNVQFRDERRYINGTTAGSFGYVRPDGRVTVTRFMSNKEQGYLTHTETFEIGAQHKWEEHWPTKKPSIVMERSEGEFVPLKVDYDQENHLNRTVGNFKPEIVDSLKQQHGVDVNGGANVVKAEDVLNPIIGDIINGKLPLQQQMGGKAGKNGTGLGFETVQNFIPSGFPIVPFELPAKEENNLEKADEKKAEPKGQLSKYDKAKANNDEKAINAESFKKAAGMAGEEEQTGVSKVVIAAGSVQQLNDAHNASRQPGGESRETLDEPKPLDAANSGVIDNQAWYEQLIQKERQDFLQNLPNLA